MKIGILLSATPGYSETFFRSKIIGLQASGHEVILFVRHKAKDFNLCPVILPPKVYNYMPIQGIAMALRLMVLFFLFPRPAGRFFRMERKDGRGLRTTLENLYLNSHILSKRLEWLHFGFATMSLRRENVARAIGAKMGVSLRGFDICIYPLKNPGCYSLLWEKVDKIHTISNDLLAVAYMEGLSPFTPVQKVTPAIDTLQFHRESPVRALTKPLRLLTVARLHWKKGLESTLEALACLKNKGVPFYYTILGEGEEYERLAFVAYQLGIFDCVVFAGKVTHERVKEEMEKADIYIQYSLQEGFCNAVLEAQAMGLLCVVSNAEGLPENIIHGETGWVVPKRQPQKLADQIKSILELSEMDMNTVRNKAIKRVQLEFNLERQRMAFLQFYSLE